jgi:hypothetical protein
MFFLSILVTVSAGSEAARCLHHAITNAPQPPQPGASGGQFQPLQRNAANTSHSNVKALQGSFIHSMGFDSNLVLRALDLFDNNEHQAIDALVDGRVPESDTRHVLRPAHQQQQLPKLTHDRVLGHIFVPVPLAPPAPAASASAAAPMHISQLRPAAACVEGQVPSAPLPESPFSVHFPPPVESDEYVHVIRLPPKLGPLRESRILSNVPRDTVGDFLVGLATMQLPSRIARRRPACT